MMRSLIVMGTDCQINEEIQTEVCVIYHPAFALVQPSIIVMHSSQTAARLQSIIWTV